MTGPLAAAEGEKPTDQLLRPVIGHECPRSDNLPEPPAERWSRACGESDQTTARCCTREDDHRGAEAWCRDSGAATRDRTYAGCRAGVELGVQGDVQQRIRPSRREAHDSSQPPEEGTWPNRDATAPDSPGEGRSPAPSARTRPRRCPRADSRSRRSGIRRARITGRDAIHGPVAWRSATERDPGQGRRDPHGQRVVGRADRRPQPGGSARRASSPRARRRSLAAKRSKTLAQTSASVPSGAERGTTGTAAAAPDLAIGHASATRSSLARDLAPREGRSSSEVRRR